MSMFMSDDDDFSRHNVPGFMENDTHIIEVDDDSLDGDEVVNIEQMPDIDNHADEDYAMSDEESEPEDLVGMHDNSDSKSQSEVNRLRKELAKANEENERKDGKLVKLEWSKGELAKDTNRLNVKVNELKEKLTTKEVDSLNGNLSGSVHGIKDGGYNPIQDRVNHLSQELSEQKEANEEKAGVIAKLKYDLELTLGRFAEDTDRMTREIEHLENTLAQEQENVKDCRAEIKDLQRRQSDLEKDLKAAGEQRAKDERENNNLRAQLKSCNEKSKDMRQDKGQMEKTMHTTIDDFQKVLAKANGDKDGYKKKYESSQGQLEEMANQLKILENAYQQQREQLFRSNHSLQKVRHEAKDTQIDFGFDGNDSRAPSRNDGQPQSTRLDVELDDELESETEGFYFIQDQGNFDETDVSPGGGNAGSSSKSNRSHTPGHGRSINFDGGISDSENGWTGTSDNDDDDFVKPSPGVGIDRNGKSAIGVAQDEAPTFDGDESESESEYDEDVKSTRTSRLLADSTSGHEKTPVDHPRQPFGIPSTSRRFWADEDTAPYAPRFDHSGYQKRETVDQGIQVEDIPRNLEPGFNEDDRERLISTLHPLFYLFYMLTILLGGMINTLIRLELALRKQFNLPTDVEYIKTSQRDQIHGALDSSPSQQDDTAQHRSEEAMTISVRKAERHLKRLVRYVLLWSCILGVLVVRLVYVWWSDDEWQWTAANKPPCCIPIELLRGHSNEHDWVQVWNFQVVKILNDRVAG